MMKWDSCADSNGTSEGTCLPVGRQGTLYLVLRLPTAGRYKFLILDTSYLILFLMSNVELRMMKEEVEFVFRLKWYF